MSLDQAVVQDHVHDVGSHIDPQRDLCLADPPHRRADAQRPVVEDKGRGDHAEIGGCQFPGLVVGSRERDQSTRAGDPDHAHEDPEQCDDRQGLLYAGDGAVLTLLSVAAGDDGRCPHAHGLGEHEHQHARLSAQAHRRDGRRPQAAHHHRIEGIHQRHQRAFQRRRPGDLQERFVLLLHIRVFQLIDPEHVPILPSA